MQRVFNNVSAPIQPPSIPPVVLQRPATSLRAPCPRLTRTTQSIYTYTSLSLICNLLATENTRMQAQASADTHGTNSAVQGVQHTHARSPSTGGIDWTSLFFVVSGSSNPRVQALIVCTDRLFGKRLRSRRLNGSRHQQAKFSTAR